MNTWNLRSLPLLALLLLIITNIVVLVGVAYNRSGEPGSVLRLSQREFSSPWWPGMGSGRENSAVSLRVQWRVLDRDSVDNAHEYYGGYYGSTIPEWLSEEKLRALGFAFPAADDQQALARYVNRHDGREVLFVLELDGPAYRESLERAQQALERIRVRAAAAPDDKELQASLRNVEKEWPRAQAEYSRLFVVDAGLDAAALRARYPDLAHYAIVPGRIQPALHYGKDGGRADTPQPGGYLAGLLVPEINVPAGTLPITPGARVEAQAKYALDIAWGKRFEPWIVAARFVPAQTRE